MGLQTEQTPLHVAALLGHTDIIRELLSRGFSHETHDRQVKFRPTPSHCNTPSMPSWLSTEVAESLSIIIVSISQYKPGLGQKSGSGAQHELLLLLGDAQETWKEPITPPSTSDCHELMQRCCTISTARLYCPQPDQQPASTAEHTFTCDGQACMYVP